MVEGRDRRNKHGLQLPSVCYKEIPASENGHRSVFVIGDVRGCYIEMCDLMNKARQIGNDVMFIFVGDLVNKGPDSKKVVDTVRKLGSSAYSVPGNHEENALREVKFEEYPGL